MYEEASGWESFALSMLYYMSFDICVYLAYFTCQRLPQLWLYFPPLCSVIYFIQISLYDTYFGYGRMSFVGLIFMINSVMVTRMAYYLASLLILTPVVYKMK